MIANAQPNNFGFITIVSIPELGHAGGLLVVSPQGRPIEFHCTAPVRENKTQKILYGQTYKGFLFCDQIANSLVEKSKATPELLVTDRGELLSLDKLAKTPIVKLCHDGEDHQPSNSNDSNHDPRGRTHFKVNGETVATEIEDSQQAQWVEQACRRFTGSLPLIEPFERIRLAIEEAQTVAR